MDPEAVVKLHLYAGNIALFVLRATNIPDNVVYIEDKEDVAMREELQAQFEHAAEVQMDELDFFTDLVESGVTLEDLKEFLPEKYDYAKEFLEEHGLI